MNRTPQPLRTPLWDSKHRSRIYVGHAPNYSLKRLANSRPSFSLSFNIGVFQFTQKAVEIVSNSLIVSVNRQKALF